MNEDGTVDWQKMWDTPGEMDWPIGCEHKLLRKHIDLITGGKANARLLVPFCGRDPELAWLLSLGHTLIGIECVEVAVKGLFSDLKLEYTVEECAAIDGHIYKSSDEKLIVYQADLFKCSAEVLGLCDGAWDRGAFEAVITLDEKKQYAELVMSCLKPKAKYLISYFKFLGGFESLEGEGDSHEGHDHDAGHSAECGEEVPGHDIDLAVVKSCFGAFGECEELDQWDATEYVCGKYKITDIFYVISKP